MQHQGSLPVQGPDASFSGGQSAYNEAIGVPKEAKTASDAPGNATASNAPYDAATGGAAGSMSKSLIFAATHLTVIPPFAKFCRC